MPHGSCTPLSKRWSSVDWSWGVSHLDTGAEVSWQSWEGSGQGVPSCESFIWVLSAVVLCAPRGMWRCTCDGLVAPGTGVGLDSWFAELNASLTSTLAGSGAEGKGGGHHQCITLWKRDHLYMGRLINSSKWLRFFKLQIKGSTSFKVSPVIELWLFSRFVWKQPAFKPLVW